MNSIKTISYTCVSLACLLGGSGVYAEETYGVSFSGSLALDENFESFPYVKPDAEPGGRIVYAEYGTYDSFSPFITPGKTPYGFRSHIYESFFKRNIDESFSLYCLLCEKIDIDDDRTYIEFFLRSEATFSDGTSVTIDDVIWSYNILAEKGSPKYGRYMSGVSKMEKTGDNSVRFDMDGSDRELPLLLGMMPIMKQADFEGRDFGEPSTEPTIGSGIYVLDDYKMGENITFKRNSDYWGKDLPVNKGFWNLEEIKYIYFADPDAMFEAMKSGDVNYFLEGEPKRWESYDFPRFNDGEVVKKTIENQRPAGMNGFVFNMRRAPFDDPKVREALIEGFNFPFVNQTVNEGAFPRIDSYFTNSYLAGGHDAASGKVDEILSSYDTLPEGAIEGYSLPKGNESGRDRDGIARAMDLLTEAGFVVQDGTMVDADGKPFEFGIMVKTPEEEKLATLWQSGLDPLGIKINIENVDSAVHADRLENYDYDVVRGYFTLSLSPGNEQRIYWGSESADTPGTRNYSGLKSPVVDDLINKIVAARSTDDYAATVQAMDRVLMAERISAPFWYDSEARMLTVKELNFPDYEPKMGLWPGYQPDAMYWEE